MDKKQITFKLSYFGKIEKILKQTWREDVISGKMLNEIIDTKELCSIKKEEMEGLSENLNTRDKAELKNLRLEWNGKYSVERRRREPVELENQIKQLLAEKDSLNVEKDQLESQISYYSIALSK